MKSAQFYILENHPSMSDLEIMEKLACQLAGDHWRQGKRVLIVCQDQQQAEKLDEMLWQNELDQFIPHNLAGEGPRNGSPVELCWPGKRGSHPRALMINLHSVFADFATAFNEVIDFVANEESLKQLARERYKTYRQIGFNLTTTPVPVV